MTLLDKTTPAPARAIALAITLLVAGIALTDFSLSGWCRNRVTAELAAPGGARRAVVFERDCGATTGVSTQIALLRRDQPLARGGANLFIAGSYADARRGRTGGAPGVSVQWLDETHLEVLHPQRIRILRARQTLRGVAVRYVSVD